jgi:tetratricopeptide (TPR) repeat protein
MVNKGVRLGEMGLSDDEIRVYDEVVKRYGQSNEPVLQRQVARALISKAVTLEKLERGKEEVLAYDEVVKRYGECDDPQLREDVARALLYKGITMGQLNRTPEAIALLKDVEDRFGRDPVGELAALVKQARKARKLLETPGKGTHQK